MTKGERHAFLLLIFIALGIMLWPLAEPVEKTDFSKLNALLDSANAFKKSIAFNNRLETFDPNQAELEDLISMGFKASVAHRMINYRLKVKPFRVKSDVLRIYGMDTAFYQRIKNYILLPDIEPRIDAFNGYSNNVRNKPMPKHTIELNAADSSALESLPCIGAKLAVRIIKYREKLGGFYHPNQLKEVYGLDSVCLPKLLERLTLDTNKIHFISINSISAELLAAHPYCGKFNANRIVNYRNQHGAYMSINQILSLKGIDPIQLKKLSPYIKFN